MFIEIEELNTVVHAHTLGNITADPVVIQSAILFAISTATSYLNAKYDCAAIFNAVGDKRNPVVLEYCKSIAFWRLLCIGNANTLYEKAKFAYEDAIDWLKQVAGVGISGKTIAPDLPLKMENGNVLTKIRMGSKPKFNHDF
ncbi:MAG: phage protein Gp36 family protein [Bacteroidales bacterium]